MIRSVTVINHQKERKEIVLANPEKSGFAITNIQGLGPVNASINMTDISSLNGAVFNSSRIGTRNIVISIVFYENPTIEATRLDAYKFFSVGKKISLEIETDSRVYATEGYVESNEPTIFSSLEGCVISVICQDPYFKSANNDEYFEYVTESAQHYLTFPFSNESLRSPRIEIGRYYTSTGFTFSYSGNVDIGIIFKIFIKKDFRYIDYETGDFVIKKVDMLGHEQKRISLNIMGLSEIYNLKNGDVIVITSIPGNKKVEYHKSGISNSLNVLRFIDLSSKWFGISPGINYFTVSAPFDLGTVIDFRYEYAPLYEGV